MADDDAQPRSPVDRVLVYQWIGELANPATRDYALQNLSERRKDIPDLGHLVWHSFGAMTILIQEITNICPMLYPGTLTEDQSKRVSHVNGLLQCVALHHETRVEFRRANTPLYLYPFLQTEHMALIYEHTRLTSLGVIGVMVKNGDLDAVNYLLSTDFIPLCYKWMESRWSLHLTRLSALTTIHHILLTDLGLQYFCRKPERLARLIAALNDMVVSLPENPYVLILRFLVRCYLRLVDDERALEVLRRRLPRQLWDDTFSTFINADRSIRLWLHHLQIKLDPSSYPYDDMEFMNAIPRNLPGVIDPNALLVVVEVD